MLKLKLHSKDLDKLQKSLNATIGTRVNKKVDFTNPETGTSIKVTLESFSRIDGDPLIHFTQEIRDSLQPYDVLSDFQLSGFEIKEIELISVIEDHIPYYHNITQGKEKIFKEVLTLFNLEEEDLIEPSVIESVIRELRILKLIDGE